MDSSIFQGGEFQRGADADGDYIHGSNEARTHNEGGPFKVFIQDEVSLKGKMLIIISGFNFTDLKKKTKNTHACLPCKYTSTYSCLYSKIISSPLVHSVSWPELPQQLHSRPLPH